MKKLGALVALLAVGLTLFFLWMARLPPFAGLPEPVEATFETLSDELDGVRISGTAHYQVRLSMARPARFGQPEATWWLFPLFPRGDTMGRTIRAMVLSPNEPDRLAGFEDMTVEAWARPPSVFMDGSVEDHLRDAGYSFTEDYVLLEMFPPGQP